MKSFFFKVALSFAVVGAVVACSKSEIEEIAPMQPSTDDIAQEGEVRIAVPEGTRSTLVDNGDGTTDLRWTSGDKITILAYDSNNSNIIMPAEEFELVGNKYNGRGAYFRAYPDLDDMAPEATYNYYAISPALNENNEDILELNGTNLSFKIPEKQDGRFRTDLDLMIAKAAGKPALEACEVERNEDGTVKDSTKPINDIGLMFYHRTHMLRFSIPDGVTNNLSDSGIKKVYLIFPDKVAGTMNVNMADDVTYDDNSGITSPVPTFSNTSNKIVVEFSSPKKAGDEFWVMTFPYAGGLQNVDIRFEDKDGNISERRKISFTNMAANRITPVNVATIPQATGVTSFYYTVGTNNLGEDLWSMNITLPEGCYFTDFEQTGKAPLKDGKHTFSIFNDMLGVVENKTLPFAFESEHALIPQTVTIGDLTDGETRNLGSMDVPYLFFEDFSNVKGANDGYVWNGPNSGSELASAGLAGWTGSRWKADANNKILILNCYVGTTAGDTNVRYGRVDTPTLYIKAGKTPTIRVMYDLGLKILSGKSLFQGSWKIQARLKCGLSDYDSNNPITFGGYYALTSLSGPGPLYPSFIAQELWDVTTCDKYSSDKMNSNKSFTTTASNISRITWFVDYYKHSGSPASKDLELYLDNIRVQIVP